MYFTGNSERAEANPIRKQDGLNERSLVRGFEIVKAVHFFSSGKRGMGPTCDFSRCTHYFLPEHFIFLPLCTIPASPPQGMVTLLTDGTSLPGGLNMPEKPFLALSQSDAT
jgi:hypothetical protein